MSGNATTPTVGVLGDRGVVGAVESVGGRALVDDAAAVAAADPAFVVAVGEASVLSAVRAGVTAPTLPVEAGRTLRSVPEEAVDAAVEALLDGAFESAAYPVVAVESPTGTVRALQDVMLVTAEPARISEYTVGLGGERVGQFRADGVVVATPAGSRGYAGAAGSPVVHPESDVVTVVPVSPFATNQDDWVLPMDGVELAVERDEAPVELLVDDRTAGAVVPGETVRLARDGTLPVAVTPESGGPFE